MQTKTLENQAGIRSRICFFAAITLAIAVLAGAGVRWAQRLVLGVDFSDESWYIATIYRFLLGDKPYADEIFLMQGFSLLPYSFFKWAGFQNSTEGIVLFGRYLYAGFNFIVAILLARVCRQQLSLLGQGLLVLAWVSFIPYGIPNLSYNTLGLGFVTLAFIALAGRLLFHKPIYWWLFYGAAMSTAVLSHPSMLLVAIVGNFTVLWLENRNRLLAWGLYIAGGVMTAVCMLTAFGISLSALKENYALTVLMNTAFNNEPGATKLVRVLIDALKNGPFLIGGFLCLLQLKYFQRLRPWLSALCLIALLPFTLLMTRASHGGMGTHGINFYLGMLPPFLFGFIKDRRLATQLLIGGWLPTAVAGVATSVTSYNGLRSSGVPTALCAVITLLFLSQWWTESSSEIAKSVKFLSREKFDAYAPSAGILPVFIFLVAHSYLSHRNIYHEDSVAQLTARIEAGPFRGLYTSEEKKKIIDDFTQALAPLPPQGRILFYPTFPAGYLMTQKRPLLPTTWGCMGLPEQVCMNYLQNHRSEEDVWVRVNRFYYFAEKVHLAQEPHFLDSRLLKPVDLQKQFQIFFEKDLKKEKQ